MHRLAFPLVIGIIGLVLTWIGNQIGWWWVATVVGVVIGISIRPAWLAIVVSLAVGGLGWGVPLAILSFTAPVGQVASVVESVIGLSATGGASIIVLTVVLGCVLSVVGSWVGIAGGGLVGVAPDFLKHEAPPEKNHQG